MEKLPEPKNRDILSKVIFPAGTVIAWVIAFLLDDWLFSATRLARKTGQIGIQNPLFIWTVVSGLVLLIVWLALAWLTLNRGRRSVPVSIIILLVGLILYIYPYLELLASWVPMLFFTVRTPLNYSGLFAAVLSILQLLLKDPRKP